MIKNVTLAIIALNILCFATCFIVTKLSKSIKTKEKFTNGAVYLLLSELSLIWIFPVAWIVLWSFKLEKGADLTYIIPKNFTLDNYIRCFTDTVYPFKLWYGNSFFIAVFSCIITTVLTLSTAYVISRFRFKLRKPYMNLAIILSMFPGFMSMIAVYYVLKSVNLTQTLTSLIIVYSASAGLNFYISKGFFDTIPKSLDEAAKIDGATNFQIFHTMIMPLARPIIIYTALTAFTAPWMDFIFARVIMGDNAKKFTVALGLWQLSERQQVYEYFNMFCAGSVLVSVPIVILFIFLQRFYVEGVTSGSVK